MRKSWSIQRWILFGFLMTQVYVGYLKSNQLAPISKEIDQLFKIWVQIGYKLQHTFPTLWNIWLG